MPVTLDKKIATILRPIPTMLCAVLVEFDPPLHYFDSDLSYRGSDGDGDPDRDAFLQPNAYTRHAAVSIGIGFGPGRIETNAFPCDADGNNLNMAGILAMNGRVDDDFTDHAEIIRWAGYSVKRATS